jgi:hypothetical protein
MDIIKLLQEEIDKIDKRECLTDAFYYIKAGEMKGLNRAIQIIYESHGFLDQEK